MPRVCRRSTKTSDGAKPGKVALGILRRHDFRVPPEENMNGEAGDVHGGGTLCSVPQRTDPSGQYFRCLLAWLSARQKGGRVVLRIEDLDTARRPRRYAEQMIEDLRWLGLLWDEGPDVGGPDGPYFQSERTPLYQAALERLEEQGLVYPRFLHSGDCTPPAPSPGGWAGDLIRYLPGPLPPGGRLKFREKAAVLRPCVSGCRTGKLPLQTAIWAFIKRIWPGSAETFAAPLRRHVCLSAGSGGGCRHGVTEVVRGRDLLDSTPRQLLLYTLLGLGGPIVLPSSAAARTRWAATEQSGTRTRDWRSCGAGSRRKRYWESWPGWRGSILPRRPVPRRRW